MSYSPPTEEADEALKKGAATYKDWLLSLEEEKKRLGDLQVLEKQFLSTRDVDLLEEFKDKREYPKVDFAEKVQEPLTSCRLDQWFEEVCDDPEKLAIRQKTLDNLDADARLLNPNVKIHNVKGKEDNCTYRVYEGIDGKELHAFFRLRNAERQAEEHIYETTPRTILNLPVYCPTAPSKQRLN